MRAAWPERDIVAPSSPQPPPLDAAIARLLSRLPPGMQSAHWAEIVVTCRVAAAWHGAQQRRAGGPYWQHLFATAALVAAETDDAVAISAAILHDTLEDTGIGSEQLAATFGADVAALVVALTKPPHHHRDRCAVSVCYQRQIMAAAATDRRVGLVKLCDRLDNLRTLAVLPPCTRRRIAVETVDFYVPLARALALPKHADLLARLATPFL